VLYTPTKFYIDKRLSELTKEEQDQRLNSRNTCIVCPQNMVVYGNRENVSLNETICDLVQFKDKPHNLTEGLNSTPKHNGKTLLEIMSSSDQKIDLKIIDLTIEPFPFNSTLESSINTYSVQSLYHTDKHDPRTATFFYQLGKKNIRVCPLADHALLYSAENCLSGWCHTSNCEKLYDYIAQNNKKKITKLLRSKNS
jgi:hypothetical protein